MSKFKARTSYGDVPNPYNPDAIRTGKLNALRMRQALIQAHGRNQFLIGLENALPNGHTSMPMRLHKEMENQVVKLRLPNGRKCTGRIHFVFPENREQRTYLYVTPLNGTAQIEFDYAHIDDESIRFVRLESGNERMSFALTSTRRDDAQKEIA